MVVPPLLLGQGYSGEASRLFQNAGDTVKRRYALLVEALEDAVDASENKTDRRKAIRQAARAVLPNATETKIFVTANVRAWRHFIEMRASAYADAEIRRLALLILDVLKAETPLLFGDFDVYEK